MYSNTFYYICKTERLGPIFFPTASTRPKAVTWRSALNFRDWIQQVPTSPRFFNYLQLDPLLLFLCKTIVPTDAVYRKILGWKQSCEVFMWGKGFARVFSQWWNFGTSDSPCHPSCQDQFSFPVSTGSEKLALLCDQFIEQELGPLHFFSLCIFLAIFPLVLVLNARSHWFWRQNLQPVIIWVYCYSAMSSISHSRNTVRHSGLISYCTAINDSMWHRAQSLKIWLL